MSPKLNELFQIAEQLFEAAYNETAKTISWNKLWRNDHGSIRGIVDHVDYRLILQHGERAKMVDDKGRKIVLLGTYYGLIVIYQTGGPNSKAAKKKAEEGGVTLGMAMGYCPLRFETTNQLVKMGFMLSASDIMSPSGLSLVLGEDFLPDIEARMKQDLNNGTFPTDGLPVFARPQTRNPRPPMQYQRPNTNNKKQASPEAGNTPAEKPKHPQMKKPAKVQQAQQPKDQKQKQGKPKQQMHQQKPAATQPAKKPASPAPVQAPKQQKPVQDKPVVQTSIEKLLPEETPADIAAVAMAPVTIVADVPVLEVKADMPKSQPLSMPASISITEPALVPPVQAAPQGRGRSGWYTPPPAKHHAVA